MSPFNPRRVTETPSLRPTRYDRVASLLISTLILSGTSVAVLVVLWLATQPEIARLDPPFGDGSGLISRGSDLSPDWDDPNPTELSQVLATEPVTDLSKLLTRESIATAITIEIDGIGVDPRPIGKPLPPEAVPRWERWEIRYEASNLQAYARQLDFFGIELAAVGRKPLVDYASRFTKESPITRSGSGSDEERLYLTWRSGRLQAMDRELLAKAGVDVVARTLLQFYPQDVEETLARLELQHTKDGRVDQLRKTVFGIRRSEDGYEFFIIEQRLSAS